MNCTERLEVLSLAHLGVWKKQTGAPGLWRRQKALRKAYRKALAKILLKFRWPTEKTTRHFLSLCSMTLQGLGDTASYQYCSIVPMMWFHLGRLPGESTDLPHTTFPRLKTMPWVIYNHLTHSLWSNIDFRWEWSALEY